MLKQDLAGDEVNGYYKTYVGAVGATTSGYHSAPIESVTVGGQFADWEENP